MQATDYGTPISRALDHLGQYQYSEPVWSEQNQFNVINITNEKNFRDQNFFHSNDL